MLVELVIADVKEHRLDAILNSVPEGFGVSVSHRRGPQVWLRVSCEEQPALQVAETLLGESKMRLVSAKVRSAAAFMATAEAPEEPTYSQGDEYDLSLLDQSVPQLTRQLVYIIDYEHLRALLEAELNGKTRKGAETAIRAAMAKGAGAPTA